jgi:mannose-1-phosphate guanylyltransferase/mannose-1-phosphate guanylyltransferase/phosphomannomutase
MAAGLGTRLAPLTDHLPKPLAPVANRPVLEHLLRGLARAGIVQVAINVHHHAEAIQALFGDGGGVGLELHWSYEPELMGTAGGVRRCAAFLTESDEPFVVTSGDGLHDVDYRALVARHREARALATLTVAQVTDPSRYGVCVLDEDGMITGFQEKPPAGEAESDLASCGVYAFSPAIFDRVPAETFVDWARNVLPPALAEGARLAAYRHDGYWNDVGTVGELLAGNLDAVTGRLDLELGPRVAASASVAPDVEVGKDVLIGDGAHVATGVQFVEPVVIGPGAVVGRDAGLRECVVLPGASVPDGGLVVGGLVADAAALADAWHERARSGTTAARSGSDG